MDALESFVVSEDGSEFLRKNQMKHRRIPLYSPWVGSMWERMIKTVKECLYKATNRSILNYFDFITILSDISDAINSRPLTYTSSANEIIPLTPNCFLKPHARTSLVLRNPDSGDPSWTSCPERESLIHTLQRSHEKFEEFRDRWYKEYLLSLREASRDLYQFNWENMVKVNDVILIKNPNQPRPFWQLGIVQQLLFGDDNKVRSAYVRTPGGQVNLYPVKHLYPLELSLTHRAMPECDPSIAPLL